MWLASEWALVVLTTKYTKRTKEELAVVGRIGVGFTRRADGMVWAAQWPR
jgi:hypothetical protein